MDAMFPMLVGVHIASSLLRRVHCGSPFEPNFAFVFIAQLPLLHRLGAKACEQVSHTSVGMLGLLL
jgi:hypothetical protein